MPDLPELVALLYHADWTQLSLSARVTERRDKAVHRRLRRLAAEEQAEEHGPVPRFMLPFDDHLYDGPDWPETELHIMVAPGGRYRVSRDDRGPATVCDGESEWAIRDGVAHRTPDAIRRPPFRGLLLPRWLLACYDLRITSITEIAGRSVHQVTATPRAMTTRRGPGDYHLLDRVQVLVDAELGVLVRSEEVFRGQTLKLAELHDLVVGPPQAADPGMFQPPPGMPREEYEGLGGTFRPEGPGWRAVRHAPHRPPRRAAGDTEARMPQDAYDFSGTPPDGDPLGDELVNLLHRTGLPAQDFAADLHEWTDPETAIGAFQAFRSAMPQPVDGILGPDQMWDAFGDRVREAGSVHRTGRLLVSMPGRYRIDHLAGDWRPKCKTVACDGEHTRKLYDDRVATGPARPLRKDLASLADPAWLLNGWALSMAGEVTVGGRRGHRIMAQAPGLPWPWAASQPFTLEVIVDVELGIVLRQTQYLGDRPAFRSELRNLTIPTRPGDFPLDTRPGLREVADTGGPLADTDLPGPVKAAGTAIIFAAGGAMVGAAALTGWLQKRRARPDFRSAPRPGG